MADNMAKRIALGSGKIYLVERTDAMSTTDVKQLVKQYAIAANEFAAI
ncbi:hypothetical protein EVA_13240, partial [gut metagenome]